MRYIHPLVNTTNKKVLISCLIILTISIIVYNIPKNDNFITMYPNATTHLIKYRSSNLYDFANDTTDIGLDVFGYLLLPNICTEQNKCPLVVFSHGSSSWRAHHERYILLLISEGVAVFKLFPFDSRGVSSTVGNQTQVTHQMVISDAFGIIPILENGYPNIDIDNIGFMGTSLGGAAALYASWNPPLMKSIHNVSREFKFYLALYPPCFIYPQTNIWSNNTIIIMIGTADRWTKADACVELFSMIYSGSNYNKLNKKIYLYDNEHHSFDDIDYMHELNGTYDFTHCRFYMDDKGGTFTISGNETIYINNATNRGYALSKCASKQNHPIGYNSKMINSHAMDNFKVELFAALQPHKLYQ